MSRRFIFIALCVVSALVLSGCIQIHIPTPTPPASAPPPVSPLPPTEAPTGTPQDSAPQGFTGSIHAFVKKSWSESGNNFIQYNQVLFLTGDAAVERAKADGEAVQDDDGNYFVEDDYYIADDDGPALITMEVPAACPILVVDLQPGETLMKSVDFAGFVVAQKELGEAMMLVKIDLSQGAAVSIREEFLP